MRPTHGNFNRLQSVVPRQIEQFGVEPKSLDSLLLENDAATLPPEGFEPALGIDKGKPQDQPDDGVEDDSGKFTESRLMHADEVAVHCARAYRNIVGLERLKEFRRFFNGRGEVGIREEHVAALRLLHPVPDAVSFATILTVGYHPQTGQYFPKRFGHLRRSIF